MAFAMDLRVNLPEKLRGIVIYLHFPVTPEGHIQTLKGNSSVKIEKRGW